VYAGSVCSTLEVKVGAIKPREALLVSVTWSPSVLFARASPAHTEVSKATAPIPKPARVLFATRSSLPQYDIRRPADQPPVDLSDLGWSGVVHGSGDRTLCDAL
jgi:hypothetical protein